MCYGCNIFDYINENKEVIILTSVVVVGGILLNGKINILEKDLKNIEEIYQRSFPLVRIHKFRYNTIFFKK